MISKCFRASQALLTLCAAVFLLSGCTHTPAHNYYGDQEVDLIHEVRAAANTLLSDAGHIDSEKPVLITSFVDIDHLQQSSTFGRQTAEVFGSEIARAKIPLIELKMRDTIFIREGTGELGLSRELRHLYQSHDAQAVLVGTYAVGGNLVYVNVRLVQSHNNLVLAAHNFSLPLNRDIRTLLVPR